MTIDYMRRKTSQARLEDRLPNVAVQDLKKAVYMPSVSHLKLVSVGIQKVQSPDNVENLKTLYFRELNVYESFSEGLEMPIAGR